MKKLQHIFDRNKDWAKNILDSDPSFFERLTLVQNPQYLWIGCSDSRVPANQITGLLPGEVFVHRNVGNVVSTTDMNCLSVLQFAVEVLEVKHVIVCGHYGCGAVQAAWDNRRFGLIDYWLSSIRSVRDNYQGVLAKESTPERQVDRLCELNVVKQASNLCQTSIIQDAWAKGEELSVHALIYRLANGLLHELDFCVSSFPEFEMALKKHLALRQT